VRLLAIPVKRSDLSNVKHRVRTSSEEIGEVRIAIVTLHSSLPSWVDAVEKVAISDLAGSGPRPDDCLRVGCDVLSVPVLLALDAC